MFRLLRGQSRARMMSHVTVSNRVPSNRYFLRSPFSSLTSLAVGLPQTYDSGSFYYDYKQTRGSLRISSLANRRMQPVYQVYGEECAFSIKVIPPQIRKYGANTLVLDSKNKGRILFEWTPRLGNGKKIQIEHIIWKCWIIVTGEPVSLFSILVICV